MAAEPLFRRVVTERVVVGLAERLGVDVGRRDTQPTPTALRVGQVQVVLDERTKPAADPQGGGRHAVSGAVLAVEEEEGERGVDGGNGDGASGAGADATLLHVEQHPDGQKDLYQLAHDGVVLRRGRRQVPQQVEPVHPVGDEEEEKGERDQRRHHAREHQAQHDPFRHQLLPERNVQIARALPERVHLALGPGPARLPAREAVLRPAQVDQQVDHKGVAHDAAHQDLGAGRVELPAEVDGEGMQRDLAEPDGWEDGHQRLGESRQVGVGLDGMVTKTSVAMAGTGIATRRGCSGRVLSTAFGVWVNGAPRSTRSISLWLRLQLGLRAMFGLIAHLEAEELEVDRPLARGGSLVALQLEGHQRHGGEYDHVAAGVRAGVKCDGAEDDYVAEGGGAGRVG
eukprot:scaffold2870_cov92-Isochrysis_galbana.AAC.2